MEKHYSVLVEELEKRLSKIQTFEKKRKTMGLTEEEETKVKTMKQEYFIGYEEMVESVVNQYLIPFIHDTQCSKWLSEIQEMIPWSGGLVIRDADFKEVSDAADKLTDEQWVSLQNLVKKLHLRAMNNLGDYANESRDNYDALQEYGKVVTGRETGNVLDLISYIDSRYREFGELMGFELAEVLVDSEK